MAYGQNLTLQQAGLRILQSRARLGIAVGQIYPQVQEAAGAYSRTKTSVNTASTKSLSRQPSFDRNTNLFDTGFDAAWELDIWGRFRRGIEVANADILASIASYDDILVSLVAEVAATYVQLRTLEERLRLAQENVQIQSHSFQIADVRFRHGAVTELDMQQAAALLQNTEASIPDLDARIRQTQKAIGGPSFSWPLFHYGRLRNNIRVQDARFQELEVSHQDTVLRAAQEVEDAIIAYLRSQEQVRFLAQSVEA